MKQVSGASMKGNQTVNHADKSFHDSFNSIFGDTDILKVYEAAMWP